MTSIFWIESPGFYVCFEKISLLYTPNYITGQKRLFSRNYTWKGWIIFEHNLLCIHNSIRSLWTEKASALVLWSKHASYLHLKCAHQSHSAPKVSSNLQQLSVGSCYVFCCQGGNKFLTGGKRLQTCLSQKCSRQSHLSTAEKYGVAGCRVRRRRAWKDGRKKTYVAEKLCARF